MTQLSETITTYIIHLASYSNMVGWLNQAGNKRLPESASCAAQICKLQPFTTNHKKSKEHINGRLPYVGGDLGPHRGPPSLVSVLPAAAASSDGSSHPPGKRICLSFMAMANSCCLSWFLAPANSTSPTMSVRSFPPL